MMDFMLSNLNYGGIMFFIMSLILADNFFVKANDGFAKLRCGGCIHL